MNTVNVVILAQESVRKLGGRSRIGDFWPKLGSLPKKYKTFFNRPPPTQTKNAKPLQEPRAT